MTTILTGANETRCDTARVEGDALWLPESGLEAASGFALRDAGFCRGELCVPVPAGRESEFRTEGRANVSALWAQLGWPTARTQAGDVWVLGEGAALFLMTREPDGPFLAGVGESSDGYSMTAPDPSGAGAVIQAPGTSAPESCVALGASPRGSMYLVRAARVRALLDGRDYATPHDIKRVAPDVLRHRQLQ